MIRALVVALLVFAGPRGIPAPRPVVHALLFYSPTCPHCHKVISEDLPPLQDKYGAALVVAGVDVTTPHGQTLYQAVVDHFGLSVDRQGVPTLVVGSHVLVGDVDIPTRFPGIIEKGLEEGGIGWPPIGAVRQALATQGMLEDQPAREEVAGEPPDTAAAKAVPPAGDTAAVEALTPATDSAIAGSAPAGRIVGGTKDTAAAERPSSREAPVKAGAAPGPKPISDTGIGALPREMAAPGVWTRFGMDPVANAIAVLVLLGMLVSLGASVRSVAGGAPPALTLPSWALPLLAALGMAVASYLAMVEMTGAVAVCGPVGNCNAVQHSSYAILFGMPVGALGQAGYLAMFGSWALAVLGPRRWRDSAWLALWAMAFVGVAFSAYLTFLEPFVIGASCMWCLTSAVVMTLMLMVATPPVAAQQRSTSP